MWVSTRCIGKTLLARFARGFPRVALGTSAGSRRCCVTSLGNRVGITAVDAAGSAMLRLWHGLGLLQMVGFNASSPADRLPGQPCARWREKQESPGAQKKRERTLARCFKQSDLDTAHRRLVESECLYGAEPHPCPWFLPSLHFFM